MFFEGFYTHLEEIVWMKGEKYVATNGYNHLNENYILAGWHRKIIKKRKTSLNLNIVKYTLDVFL